MKQKSLSGRTHLPSLIAVSGLLISAVAVHGEVIFKADTGTDLSAGASWLDGAPPTALDIATWDSGSLGSALTLPSGASWLGINLAAALANIDISGTGTLTLGAGGINAATTVALAVPLALGADQTWSTTTGFVIGSTGAISGGNSLTASGTGTVNLSGASTYSGGTTLQGLGVLAAGHANALGSGPLSLKSTSTGAATTLLLTGGVNLPNPITIDLTTGREGFRSEGASNTLGGNITINGSDSRHVFFNNSGDPGSLFTVSGPITGLAITEGIGFRGLAGNFGLVSGKVNIGAGFFQINGAATWTITSTGNTWARTRIQGADGGFTLGAHDALATAAELWFGNDTSGAFDMAGFNQTIAGLDCNATSRTPTVGNSSTTSDSHLKINGNGYNFAGILADTLGDGSRKLSLELLSGEQSLSGVNTYTGATTISGGTLRVTGSLAESAVAVKAGASLTGTGFLAGPVTLESGGTLTPGGGSGSSFITLGSLSLGTTGGDTQTIQLIQNQTSVSVVGSLAPSGTTTINVGTATGFTVGQSNLIAYNGPLVSSGFILGPLPPRVVANLDYTAGSIDLNVTSVDSLKWTGANSGNWDTLTENWKLAVAGTPTTYIDGNPGDTVLFDDSLLGNPDLTLSTTLSPESVVFDTSATDYSLSGPGSIAGTAGITKTYTGIDTRVATLTLSSANTFSGEVNVAAGILEVTNSNALGSSTGGTSVSANAALHLQNDIAIAQEPLTIGGGGITNFGAIRNLSGNNSWTGNITLSATTCFTADSGSLSLGAISGTNRSLVLNGAGNITVNGAITTGSGAVTVDNFNGTGASAGVMTFNGANTYTGTTTVASGTLTLAGERIASSGGIVVGNTEGQIGTLNIQAGIFSMGTNAFQISVNNGASTAIVNHSGGTLTMTGGNQVLMGNGTVAGSSGIYNLSGGTLRSTATSATRGVILGVNTNTGGTFNLSGNGILEIPASALLIGRSDSAANNTVANFHQTGGSATVGTLTLGSRATNSGGIANMTLAGGTFTSGAFTKLSVGNNDVSAITIAGTADVTLPAFPTARGTGSTATITFDGGTLRPAAESATYISGSPSSTFARLTANGANFNVAAGKNITIPLALDDAPSQSGVLTKSGVGKLTLTGPNSYSGSTVVNAGVLATNGTALADSSRLVINAGQVEASGTEIVNTLFFGAAQQPAGTYGATGSGATNINDTFFTGTGVVNVITGPGGIASYSDWAAANAPGQTADQDHDNDGVKNGVEYFMGETGSSFTANPAPIAGKVTWPKDPAYSGTYVVQTSGTLESNDWNAVPAGDPNLNDTGSSVQYTLPTGQGKLFIRIKVTPN